MEIFDDKIYDLEKVRLLEPDSKVYTRRQLDDLTKGLRTDETNKTLISLFEEDPNRHY